MTAPSGTGPNAPAATPVVLADGRFNDSNNRADRRVPQTNGPATAREYHVQHNVSGPCDGAPGACSVALAPIFRVPGPCGVGAVVADAGMPEARSGRMRTTFQHALARRSALGVLGAVMAASPPDVGLRAGRRRPGVRRRIVIAGACRAKCTVQRGPNTCGQRVPATRRAHGLLLRHQACVAAVEDDTGKPVQVPDSGRPGLGGLDFGTPCPWGSVLTRPAPAAFCDPAPAAGPQDCDSPRACGDDNRCNIGKCSSGDPCGHDRDPGECAPVTACPNGLQCDPGACEGDRRLRARPRSLRWQEPFQRRQVREHGSVAPCHHLCSERVQAVLLQDHGRGRSRRLLHAPRLLRRSGLPRRLLLRRDPRPARHLWQHL